MKQSSLADAVVEADSANGESGYEGAAAGPAGSDSSPWANPPLGGWPKTGAWELLTLAAIVGVFLALGVALILARPPLGHDEAVYALRSRYYAGDFFSFGYWADYRALGLPAIMRLAYPAGSTDAYLRAVVLMFGAAGIVLTWAWARRWFGINAGLYSAAILCVVAGYLRTGYRIFVDTPAAALGLAALLVFALACRRDGVRRWALLVIPLAALATAVRYGAPALLGIGLTIVALANWRSVRKSVALVATIAVGVVASSALILLVPAVTGSSDPPLFAFADRQEDKDLSRWASYLDFFDVIPDAFGSFVGVLALVGVVLAVIGVALRRVDKTALLVVLGIAVGFFVALNFSLAEGAPQYLVPGMAFVAIAAGAGWAFVLRGVPQWAAPVVVAVILILGGLAAYDAGQEAGAKQEAFDTLEEASALVAAESGDCLIVTSYSPQVGWYSGCAVTPFPRLALDDPEIFEEELLFQLGLHIEEVSPDATVYWMLPNDGKRQPTEEVRPVLDAMTEAELFTHGDPEGRRLAYIEVGVLGTASDITPTEPRD